MRPFYVEEKGKTTMHPLKRLNTLLPLFALLLTACGGGEDAAPEVSAERLAELSAQSEAYQGMNLQQLRRNPDALALGGELAAAHCAGCHGGEGREPQRGVPALTGAFDYGDSADAVRTTITQGRHSVMPPLGGHMGEVEIGALVAKVRGFSTGEGPSTFAKTAEELYTQHCVACHGAEGKGNPEIGAPDLTDQHWQYGDAMMNVRLNITRGLDTRHPAMGEVLGQAEVDLLTAYVLELRE